MKIVYFLKNGVADPKDLEYRGVLKKEGHTVTFSNGSVTYGFEDKCDAVVMNAEFEHVRLWAEWKCIEIIESKPEPEPEPTEKPKQTRRTRKTSDK